MLNIGVLGLGRIAHRFVESLENFPEATFYAGASYTKEKREIFLNKYHPHIIYDNYFSLLEDEEVDVVYICVPHGMHYKWVKEALEHNKCVICEKPIVLLSSELEELIQIAKERHLFLMEAMKTRFYPLTRILHNEINRGLIGDIKHIETHFNFRAPYNEKSYLFDKKQGGSLYDTGCYNIATVLDYIDSDVKNIEVKVRKKYDVDVYNHIELTFESGQTALIECSMDDDNNRKMVIYGTKGKITVDPFYRPQEARFDLDNGESQTCLCEYEYDDFHDEIKAALHAIAYLKLETEEMTHNDSLKCIQLLESIKKIS